MQPELESTYPSISPTMVKPHQLANGRIIDVRQAFSNLPHKHHWIFNRIYDVDDTDDENDTHFLYLNALSRDMSESIGADSILWGQKSYPVWNIISLYGYNLARTLKKTGGGFVDKYIETCHKAIFSRADASDMWLLLYKLYCHIQYFDLTREY